MSEVRQVVPGPEIKRFRRIVTGHDPRGRSVFLSDQASPHVMPIMGQPNFAVTDFWKTASTPADNSPKTSEDSLQPAYPSGATGERQRFPRRAISSGQGLGSQGCRNGRLCRYR